MVIDGNMEQNFSEKTFSRNETSIRDRKRKVRYKNKNDFQKCFDRKLIFI